jgi:hypothetical protein
MSDELTDITDDDLQEIANDQSGAYGMTRNMNHVVPYACVAKETLSLRARVEELEKDIAYREKEYLSLRKTTVFCSKETSKLTLAYNNIKAKNESLADDAEIAKAATMQAQSRATVAEANVKELIEVGSNMLSLDGKHQGYCASITGGACNCMRADIICRWRALVAKIEGVK